MSEQAFVLTPIGYVHSSRTTLQDDEWDSVTSRIELTPDFEPEALDGIEDFSHAEILFVFNRAEEREIDRGARHPRGNMAWPRVGIFAQRGSRRPNLLGATIVRIVARLGRTLAVAGLDAADGTPVVDIKPVMSEYLPRGDVRQPEWSRELMRRYWRDADAGQR
jgi:tRNA-Thr(GGU) m(6)t(6)A37 methyltransferase TsaA